MTYKVTTGQLEVVLCDSTRPCSQYYYRDAGCIAPGSSFRASTRTWQHNAHETREVQQREARSASRSPSRCGRLVGGEGQDFDLQLLAKPYVHESLCSAVAAFETWSSCTKGSPSPITARLPWTEDGVLDCQEPLNLRFSYFDGSPLKVSSCSFLCKGTLATVVHLYVWWCYRVKRVSRVSDDISLDPFSGLITPRPAKTFRGGGERERRYWAPGLQNHTKTR